MAVPRRVLLHSFSEGGPSHQKKEVGGQETAAPYPGKDELAQARGDLVWMAVLLRQGYGGHVPRLVLGRSFSEGGPLHFEAWSVHWMGWHDKFV